MRSIKLFLWSGIILIVIPYMGIPGVWKERLSAFIGILLIVFVIRAYYSFGKPVSTLRKDIPKEEVISE